MQSQTSHELIVMKRSFPSKSSLSDSTRQTIGYKANQSGESISQQHKCTACDTGGAPCPACSLSLNPAVGSVEQEQLQRQANGEEELLRQPLTEEEKLVQTKRQPDTTSKAEANRTLDAAETIRSGGEPLPEAVRLYFEPRFDANLGGVRVHTGKTADRATASVNARAFTLGNSIAFAPGQYEPNGYRGRKLLAHELTHVLQRQGNTIQRAEEEEPVPAPATPSLDLPANIRTLQAHLNLSGAGLDVNGLFGETTSRALETWQLSKSIPPSGVVDPATMDIMLAEMIGFGMHEFAIPLIADAEGLDLSDVAAMRVAWTWEASWPEMIGSGIHIDWEGSLREMWVAKWVLGSYTSLVAALSRGLSVMQPPVSATPIKLILNPTAERNAIEQVGSRLAEPIAITALRGIVGATAGSVIDPELVHRLADLQPPGSANGQLDDATLDLIVTKHRKGRENSVLRLVMDAFDLGSDALVAVMFENKNIRGFTEAMAEEFRSDPEKSAAGATPSILYIGPHAFRSLSTLVQTLMHELVHVDLSAQGINQGSPGTHSRRLHEFLGEATELLVAPQHDALETVLQDGNRALTNWNRMDRSDRVEQWATFEEVRKVVLAAYPNIPPSHNSHYRAEKIKNAYESVKAP
ncbi:MAG: DUF4157 domain-containing protein [Candidatus Thiodiazotropha sp. (ex Codakia rugifera)]|nr:DUF4157 domain-containing protein [Candidatus Thiodiazotropha sp. (ex Codakia rugifera)]